MVFAEEPAEKDEETTLKENPGKTVKSVGAGERAERMCRPGSGTRQRSSGEDHSGHAGHASQEQTTCDGQQPRLEAGGDCRDHDDRGTADEASDGAHEAPVGVTLSELHPTVQAAADVVETDAQGEEEDDHPANGEVDPPHLVGGHAPTDERTDESDRRNGDDPEELLDFGHGGSYRLTEATGCRFCRVYDLRE